VGAGGKRAARVALAAKAVAHVEPFLKEYGLIAAEI
jgi:hypothetical protein